MRVAERYLSAGGLFVFPSRDRLRLSGRRVIIKARAFPRSFKNGGLNRRFSPMVIWSSYRVEYHEDIVKHRPSYQGNKLRFFKKIFYCEKVITWYYVLQNFLGNRVELRFVEY